MSGVRSLGYWSRETSHYLSHYRNNDGISEDEIIEVSSGNGIRGNRYLETSYTYSINCVGCGSRSSMTSLSSSCNCGGYIDIGGSRSQDTS